MTKNLLLTPQSYAKSVTPALIEQKGVVKVCCWFREKVHPLLPENHAGIFFLTKPIVKSWFKNRAKRKLAKVIWGQCCESWGIF